MREATRRPGAEGDAAGPQSADADSDAEAGGGDATGDAQASARQQRAQKRRGAARDAEADAFNQRHAAEVAEFNQRTRDACLGEDGTLDAEAVKQWQREHQVAPDGKVGPKTLAAAGGKAKGEKADSQLTPVAGNGAPKAKGPIEDIVSWLDSGTVHQVLEAMKSLAKGAEGGNSKQLPKVAEPTAANATGLASTVSLGQFVDAAKKLEAEQQWTRLKPAQRAERFVEAANVQLEAAGVRPIHWKFSSEVNEINPGKFAHASWTMLLDRHSFSTKKLKPAQGASVANTIYHESRHAEQNFHIAQALAGQKQTTDEIYAATGIDRPTIAHAARQPLAPGSPDAATAQAMFDDKYGAGREHHRLAEHVARAKLEEYNRARAPLDDPSAAPEQKEAAQKQVEAMKPDVIAAWNAYANLATESDALAVGNKAGAAMAAAP